MCTNRLRLRAKSSSEKTPGKTFSLKQHTSTSRLSIYAISFQEKSETGRIGSPWLRMRNSTGSLMSGIRKDNSL